MDCDERSEELRGNLHAYEYLLGQLFVMILENGKHPQEFLLNNALDIADKLARNNLMTDSEKKAAYGSVRRVMETASLSLETSGKGAAIDLRSKRGYHNS